MGHRKTPFLRLLKILLFVILFGSCATVLFLIKEQRHMHIDLKDKDNKLSSILVSARSASLEGLDSRLNSGFQHSVSDLPGKTTQYASLMGNDTSVQQQRKAALNRALGKSEVVRRTSRTDEKTVLSKKIALQDHTLESRLLRVMQNCKKLGNYQRNYVPQSQFYFDTNYKLLYCKVAKVGCTFWERVFAFINNPSLMEANNFTRITDIPRWRIHFDANLTHPINSWQKAKNISGPSPGVTRFLFTRDPFSRMWSAYLDKIWLPDFWYWLPIGSHTTRQLRDRCLTNVTFEEFMQLVSIKKHNNPHWTPVHESCNPCVFQPDVIGNMTTFVSDALGIMSMSGIQDLDNFFQVARDQTEIQTLVEYNYERFDSVAHIFRYCNFTKKDLAFRLWKTFQINGYISKDLDFPEDLQSYDKRSVLTTIGVAQEKLPLTLAEGREQRNDFMKKAFRSLRRDTINKFVKKFYADFLLFDFNPRPDFLHYLD